jgi:hypothetical protein
MVEFALTIPLMLAMIVGIFEGGRLLWIYSAVSSASREAARVGSSVSDNGSGTPYYLDCARMRQEALELGAPGGVESADITIQYDHGPGTSVFGNCPVSADDIALGDRVVVVVVGHYAPSAIIPLVNLPTFDISSESYRTILKGVSLEAPAATSTSAGGASATPTVTAGGGATATATTDSTATATITPTPNPTATPSHTPSPTSGNPPPPEYVTVSWNKQGSKCQWPTITVDSNSAWASNPGYGPSNYQVFKDGSAADWINTNYPGSVTWNSWDTLNHNQTRSYGFQGIFNWPLRSEMLTVTFKCVHGNLVQQ